jgi:hypothetical protein
MRRFALICGCSLIAMSAALADGNYATSNQSGTGNSSVSTQEGTGNSTNTTQSGSENSTMTTQGGSGNTSTAEQSGSGNTASTTQGGSSNGALTIQDGNSNTASITQTGRGDSAAIGQKGDNNVASIVQNGDTVTSGGSSVAVGPGGLNVNGRTYRSVTLDGAAIAFNRFENARVSQLNGCTRAVYTHSSGRYQLIVNLGKSAHCQTSAQICFMSTSRQPAACTPVRMKTG